MKFPGYVQYLLDGASATRRAAYPKTNFVRKLVSSKIPNNALAAVRNFGI